MTAVEPEPDGTLPPGPLLRLVRDRRVAYVLVGAVNTLNGFVLFVLFHLLLGDGFVRYMTTLALTHVVATACAFVLHRRFVFRVRGNLLIDAARFELVNLGALAINAALLPLFVEVAGISVIPAQLLAAGIAIMASYVGHSAFSFRRSRKHTTGPAA